MILKIQYLLSIEIIELDPLSKLTKLKENKN